MKNNNVFSVWQYLGGQTVVPAHLNLPQLKFYLADDFDNATHAYHIIAKDFEQAVKINQRVEYSRLSWFWNLWYSLSATIFK